jgi:hypothetical protein
LSAGIAADDARDRAFASTSNPGNAQERRWFAHIQVEFMLATIVSEPEIALLGRSVLRIRRHGAANGAAGFHDMAQCGKAWQ